MLNNDYESNDHSNKTTITSITIQINPLLMRFNKIRLITKRRNSTIGENNLLTFDVFLIIISTLDYVTGLISEASK